MFSNTHFYNFQYQLFLLAVINAWAKVGTAEAAQQAEQILQRMLRPNLDGASNEDRIVRPDTVVFNAVINAWATSKDLQAGTKSLDLMRQMKELANKQGYDTEPDIVTYNTVLSAWSHCGHVNAAPQTEKIVQDMQAAANESEKVHAPNTVSYNCILNAWSKSSHEGAAPRAQKVLDYMIAANREEIAPDIYSFTSVLDAWAKSKEPNKGVRTRELLDKMLALYESTKRQDLRPTQVPYNTVLNACAFSALGPLWKNREKLFKSLWKPLLLCENLKYRRIPSLTGIFSSALQTSCRREKLGIIWLLKYSKSVVRMAW